MLVLAELALAELVLADNNTNTSWSVQNCSPDVILNDASSVTRIRVAILLSGLIARQRNGLISGRMPNVVWQSWSKYVVQKLESETALVSTFLCAGPADEVPNSEIVSALRIVHVDRSELDSSTLRPVLVPRLAEIHGADAGQTWRHHQWARLRLCFAHAVAHEFSSTDSSIRFTHFIRGRPDEEWFQPLPSLHHALAHSTVAVRALMLHLGVWRKSYVDGAALVGGNCNVSPGCSSRLGACMVADDQFALVPRAYASAYFAQCRASDEHPEMVARRRASALPKAGSPQAREHRNATPYTFREWAPESYCTQHCSTCTELGNRSRGHGMRTMTFTGTCTEVLLTTRLKELGVVFSVAPFDFRCIHMHGDAAQKSLSRRC